MRLYAILAVLVFALASTSVAQAQHDKHHGKGESGGDAGAMSCCDAMSSMGGDNSNQSGSTGMMAGKCDMSKCGGEMMAGMEMCKMMEEHAAGAGGGMDDMMRDHHRATGDKSMRSCGKMMKDMKMKEGGAMMECCGKSKKDRGSSSMMPTLK